MSGAIALDKHFEIPTLKPARFMIESLGRPAGRGPPMEAAPEGSEAGSRFFEATPLSISPDLGDGGHFPDEL